MDLKLKARFWKLRSCEHLIPVHRESRLTGSFHVLSASSSNISLILLQLVQRNVLGVSGFEGHDRTQSRCSNGGCLKKPGALRILICFGA